MELSTQEQIKNLQKAITKDDDQEAIFNISSALLKNNPDDSEYQQCLAISSIKLGKFDHLSQTIFKQMPKTGGQLDNLYAYFLYSSGKYQKCLQVLKQMKQSTSVKILLSQVYFKLMDYQKSADLLAQILRQQKLQQDDRQLYMVNLLAAGESKHHNMVRQQLKKNRCKQLMYNYALLMYEINDIENTYKYLNGFEEMLTKKDEEDYVSVKIFKDYLQIKNEEMNSNLQLEYEKMLNQTTNTNIKGVLTNNLIYLKGNQESLADANKHIDEMMDITYKIGRVQLIILKINKMSILLRRNRFTEAVKLLKEIQEISNDKFLLFNFEFIRNKYYALKKTKDEAGIEKLIKQLNSSNQSALGFCLMSDYAQEKDNIQVLFKSLGQWDNSIIQNYIFSQMIRTPALFEQNSQKLQELIDKTTDPKILQILLKVYQSKNDQIKQETVLKKLLKINPKNTLAKTRMAKICLQNGNIKEAEDLLKGVQPPEDITDLTYLQYIEKNIHISIKKEEQPQHEHKKQTHKKRIKKKKKPRLPKNMEKFIEGYKGDPQRWLPKWQRKGYKKRKKGGKTQGLATVGKQQKNVYTVGASTSAKEVTKDQKKRR